MIELGLLLGFCLWLGVGEGEGDRLGLVPRV